MTANFAKLPELLRQKTPPAPTIRNLGGRRSRSTTCLAVASVAIRHRSGRSKRLVSGGDLRRGGLIRLCGSRLGIRLVSRAGHYNRRRVSCMSAEVAC